MKNTVQEQVNTASAMTAAQGMSDTVSVSRGSGDSQTVAMAMAVAQCRENTAHFQNAGDPTINMQKGGKSRLQRCLDRIVCEEWITYYPRLMSCTSCVPLSVPPLARCARLSPCQHSPAVTEAQQYRPWSTVSGDCLHPTPTVLQRWSSCQLLQSSSWVSDQCDYDRFCILCESCRFWMLINPCLKCTQSAELSPATSTRRWRQFQWCSQTDLLPLEILKFKVQPFFCFI